ncbi:hypothetical protein RJT34_30966 [Clitoria ternatea]|uniref:Uncharacterized protein n=1 Tax=Clitoria ternatea TaxID=43366 RepID=A0AAN9I2G8_CLITE
MSVLKKDLRQAEKDLNIARSGRVLAESKLATTEEISAYWERHLNAVEKSYLSLSLKKKDVEANPPRSLPENQVGATAGVVASDTNILLASGGVGVIVSDANVEQASSEAVLEGRATRVDKGSSDIAI